MKKSAPKTTTAAKKPAPATKAGSASLVTSKTVAAKKPAPAAPTVTPAPAAKRAKVSTKPAAAPAAAPLVAKVATPAPAPKPVVPVKAKVVAPKVEPKVAAVNTVIAAQIDIGFGNALFLRGEGPGLSWEVGLPMACDADDRWIITLPESGKLITFKFLINDTVWSVGDDYSVLSGTRVELSPVF